jgi:hypothetical protein
VSKVPGDADHSHAKENYGKLPLAFEANVGQTDSRVDFLARTGGATVFLTPTAAVFSLRQRSTDLVEGHDRGEPWSHQEGYGPRSEEENAGAALHMQIVGANPNTTPLGQERQPGIVNYFIGNDPAQWHTNIPTYGRVEYDEVYPGIDLVYYSNNQQLEYDFVVAPGANPKTIALSFAGANGVEIDDHANLVVHTVAGDVVQQKPYLYQEVNGARIEVTGHFALSSAFGSPHSTLVSFDVGAYDRSLPLVIDPLVLGYSTFLGGSGSDTGRGVAVDSAGYAYVTGSTQSTNFPTTPGTFDPTHNGGYEAFVAKLTPDGSALAYATYLGGSNSDGGSDIAVDGGGTAYVTGGTQSTNFPTTPGALDTSYNGSLDVFVTKLDESGSGLTYSTFLGGSGFDERWGIAVDGRGSAYLTGHTGSQDFPTTQGAFDMTPNGEFDGFVTKLNSTGSTLVYSTFLGGSAPDAAWGMTVDSDGNLYVSGVTRSTNFPITPGAFDSTFSGGFGLDDTFVTKLNADGSALVYSTFLGGNSQDAGTDMAVDAGGYAYVIGATRSRDFPTTPGAFDSVQNGSTEDAFVTKLNVDGSALAYSTFLGGFDEDYGLGIVLDASGNVYMTGVTKSSDFPTTFDAFDNSYNGGAFDTFMAVLNTGGATLAYSTMLGGASIDYGWGIALHSGGSAYVIGYTSSGNFPTIPGAFDATQNGGPEDAFVTKFSNVTLTAKGDV